MHTAGGTLAAEWPLIGRDDELARILRAREQEDCRGVVVSAGPGVGKSRLAREARAVLKTVTDVLAAPAEGAIMPSREPQAA